MAISVWPQEGRTFPDALGNPITSVGATVDESTYIKNAIDAGYLLDWDPLGIYSPDDRTGLTANAPSDAGFITVGNESGLSEERVLTAGTGISIVDGGPEGPITISNTSPGAVSSVFGRIGAVLAQLGDYSSSLITNLSTVTGATVTAALDALLAAIGLKVTGPVSANDERLARFDGTTGKLIQNSAVALTDAGAMSGLTGVDVTGNITLTGTVDGVDVSNLAAVPYVTIGNTTALPNERALTAGAGISITDGGAGGAVTVDNLSTFRNYSADTTLGLIDAGKTINITGGGSYTMTIPHSSTVSWKPGTIIRFIHVGNGLTTTIAPAANVTIKGCALTLSANDPFYDCVELILSSTGATDFWFATSPNNISRSTFVTTAATSQLPNERVLTAGAGISITDGGAGGAVTVANNANLETISGSTYTVVAADDGKTKVFTAAGGCVVTLPTGFGAGMTVKFYENGGQVSFVPSGSTLSLPPGKSAKINGTNGWCTGVFNGGVNWYLHGDDLEETHSLVTLGATTRFPNERVLTAGAGISITDGGAGGAVTVAAASAGSFLYLGVPGTQSLATGTFTKLDLTAAIDPAASFNNATDTWLIPATGTYMLQAFFVVATAAVAAASFRVRLSGTTTLMSTTDAYQRAGGNSIIVKALWAISGAGAGADLTFEVQQNSGSSATITEGGIIIQRIS